MIRSLLGALGLFLALFVVVLIVANRSGAGDRGHRHATGDRPRLRGDGDNEARMIQEIHASLTRMDQRIEALETILMDRLPRQ